MAGPIRVFLAAVYLISCWIIFVSPVPYRFKMEKIEKTDGSGCDMTGLKLANQSNDSLTLAGPVSVKEDALNTTVVNIMVSEKKGNEYKRNMFMNKNNINLCTVMRNNNDTVNEMGNVPSSCPIKEGKYQFNYTADTKRLPSTFPLSNQLKVTIEALAAPNGKVICRHDAYITVIQNTTTQQSRRRG